MPVLKTSMFLPLPRAEVFDFFARAENLERITPPELRFRITSQPPIRMRAGARILYELQLFGIRFGWETCIDQWQPPRSFIDRQLRGPYAEWVHTHTFTEVEGGTRVDDEVHYRLPLAPFGIVAWPIVRLQLRRIFRFRESAIRRLLLEGAANP